MNWEAIGAIGEVVGAFGVIASLGYLAIQIRQNTEQMRQSTEVGQVASYNQAQEQTWQAPLAMAQDSEAVRSLAKLSEQGFAALSAEDTVRPNAIPGTFFHGIDSLFKLYEKGLVDPENWENILENQLDAWWSKPHVIAYIRSRPVPISQRFASHVERRIAEAGRG